MSKEIVWGQRYGTVGWQEFLRQKQDILGDYDKVKEYNINRPVRTEHGKAVESSVRNWLSGFLPKKYGVTSGFIIPDIKVVSYQLNHYDVIIYDALNSPILWASGDYDNSEQGKVRAIPSQYVHAVFEVKSSLDGRTIQDAKQKLREMNAMTEHLNPCFFSSIIFCELRANEHKSCKILEKLYANDIFAYCGGLVLRAQQHDESIAAYYSLFDSGERATVETMPSIREIGGLKVDEQGNPMLIEQGDSIEAISGDGVWHFNKAYSPVVNNVIFSWSHNSFPKFCFHTLARLEGIKNPAELPLNSYGKSFLMPGN